MMTTASRFLAVLALAGAAATAVDAAPITVKYDGFVAGSKSGRIYGPEVNRRRAVLAGQFDFDVTSDPTNAYWDDELQAFCIDVTQTLETGAHADYDLTLAEDSGYLSTAQLANISWLYDNVAMNLGTAQTDASFQLALWELMYDSSPLSLIAGSDAGTFWSNSFGGAQATAEGWLTNLTAAGISDTYRSSSYDLYVLRPTNPVNNQTLIIARPIPEPSVLALLGLGFVAIGLARRRRSA